MFGERRWRCKGYYRCHISNKNYIFVGTLKGKLVEKFLYMRLLEGVEGYLMLT